MDSYCQNCGTKLEGAKFCPNCGQPVNQTEQNTQPVQITEQQPIQPPEQGAKKKTRTVIEQPWFWAVSIAVIVFLVVILIVCVPKNSNSSSSKNYNQSQSSSTKSYNKPTTNTNNRSTEKPTEKSTLKDYYSIGESCEIDGLIATVNSCELFDYDSNFIKPKDGYVFIKVNVTVENQSGNDETIGSVNFDCYANNEAIENRYFAVDDYLSYDSVASGRHISGSLYYEIPQGSEVELEFAPWLFEKNKAIYKLDY